MKKFLLSLFLVSGALFSFNRLNAQCDLSFPNLARAFSTDITPLGPNKCQYTIDVSFDIVTNSGFKYLFFHSWLLQDYPNPPIFDCSGNTPAVDPGTSAQLGTAIDDPGKSFNDIGFINLNDLTFAPDVPVNVTANIATTYPHDPSVVLNSPLNSPGMMATITRQGNSDTLHFEITNLKVIVNTPCGTPVIIKTDIWGSNSNAPDPKAQCYVCGIGQSFGDPTIALQKVCAAVPFQYSVALTAASTVDLHVVYRLYADDLDGIREPDGDDSLLFVSDTIIVNSTTPFSSGLLDLPGDFCCSEPWSLWGIYVEVTAREFVNTLSTPVVEEACAASPLPVSLRLFTAARNNSNVLLKWETVSEQNSRGFYVERNLGNNIWQTLGFVETKAANGSSNSLLKYDFSDLNNAKGISQYRLRQVDIDGKHAYSPIRAVRAGSQKGKTIVYPNPSADGKVNVVFADVNTPRDVSLSDLNGRIIKQWKSVTTNNIQIDNLLAGFYTIRIVDTETGEQTVEKIVVKKR
ncbi:MAG TPA: T9SS type A sorting domain-containing protein [Chitinophagaceae bacterium]|nr:T9SS type A sorting domain-containing protein [Chitinophagaceae bacterium]